MMRSVKAIDRFFIILSVAHFFFTTALNNSVLSFADSVHFLRDNWAHNFKFAL